MRISDKISAERSAFYKAGYILLHLLTDITIIDNVVIYKNRETNGFSSIETSSPELNSGKFKDYVIMCLRAGPMSEKHYCHLKCISYDTGISGDDIWKISRLFFEGNNESVNYEKHLRVLEDETEKIIKSNWPFVTTIAKEVFRKSSLTINEINELRRNFPIISNLDFKAEL